MYQKLNKHYTKITCRDTIFTDVVGKYFWIYMQ